MIPLGVLAGARVAVSGAWAPTTLASLAGWWDASDTATITATAGAVSQWDDKSGNGLHFYQSTAAAKPTTGTVTINGLNALDCASGDTMSTTAGAWTPANLTVIAVMSKSPGTTPFILDFPQIAGANTSPFVRFGAWAYTGGVEYTIDTTKSVAGSTLNNAGPVIFVHTNGTGGVAGAWGAWVNGTRTLTGTGKTVTYPNSVPFKLSGNGNDTTTMIGTFAEVIACGAVLSDTDRQKTEGYLAHKWGLTGNLPAGHPYLSAPPA